MPAKVSAAMPSRITAAALIEPVSQAATCDMHCLQKGKASWRAESEATRRRLVLRVITVSASGSDPQHGHSSGNMKLRAQSSTMTVFIIPPRPPVGAPTRAEHGEAHWQ